MLLRKQVKSFGGVDLAAVDARQDLELLCGLILGRRVLWLKAEFLDQLVETAAHGPVRDAELALHLFDVAPAPAKGQQKASSLGVEPAKGARLVAAQDDGLTGSAVEARDLKRAATRGTLLQDFAHVGPPFLSTVYQNFR